MIVGRTAIAEAWEGGDLNDLREKLRAAVKETEGLGENAWPYIHTMTPENLVFEIDGENVQFDWTEAEDGTITCPTGRW